MVVIYFVFFLQVFIEYFLLIFCVYNGFIFKECLYLLDYYENVFVLGEVIV